MELWEYKHQRGNKCKECCGGDNPFHENCGGYLHFTLAAYKPLSDTPFIYNEICDKCGEKNYAEGYEHCEIIFHE